MMVKLILFSGFAGITVFLGGILSKLFSHHVKDTPVKYEFIHGMMSFGAGIMLSAIALVLIPSGMDSLDVVSLSITFLIGAVAFLYIDRLLAKQGGQVSTLLAMMMDFVPESIALGAVFASDLKMASLLAVFIGLQNLPEAFNSYRDMVQSGFKANRTIFIFLGLSFFGVVGALIGFFFLKDYPVLTSYLMTFAGGGILYLLVRDIIPKSNLESSYLSSLGACLGFLIGMIGEKLI